MLILNAIDVVMHYEFFSLTHLNQGIVPTTEESKILSFYSLNNSYNKKIEV